MVFVVAACGDDGGNNNGDDMCGDGQKTGAEQCDDGNTMNGDGCSSTCRNESSGPVCGDGVMSGNEECDDSNTMDGDGCSATCMDEEKPETCGNGQLDTDEDCDDGNPTANDGCSACNVDNGWTCDDAEPSVCTMVLPPDGSCTMPFPIILTDNAGTLEGMAMGDTTGGTSHIAAATCDGDDAGAGNDLVYSFTIADTRDVTLSTNDNSPFDLIIRVTTAACMLNTELPEFNGADGCADELVTFGEELTYSALPAGTYFVHIDGFDATAAGAFTLSVSAAVSTCGDGVVDLIEHCDDDNMTAGDGCSARCDVEDGYSCDNTTDPSVCELLCGNGVLDADEECDDAGLAAADGCSATCTLEYDVLEAEDNDTTPQTITAQNHIIKGSFVAGDVDLYQFTLAAPARVEIETYDTIDASEPYAGVGTDLSLDCYENDTLAGVFPMGATVTDDNMALYRDDDDGTDACSYIGANDSSDFSATNPNEGVLAAGTYIIKLEDFDGIAVDRYLVKVKIIQAVAAGDLAINEFMAADNVSDTNCDASTSDTVDEFVEIVNKGTHTVDITGVTISDVATLRHTFAPGTSGSMFLDPGKAVVVWGGGAPACPGVNNWFVASSNSLGLNDAGDTITVATGGGTPVQLAQYVFAAQTTNVSSNLDVDITGTTYMLHNAVTGHVGDFTPGKRVNNTPF